MRYEHLYGVKGDGANLFLKVKKNWGSKNLANMPSLSTSSVRTSGHLHLFIRPTCSWDYLSSPTFTNKETQWLTAYPRPRLCHPYGMFFLVKQAFWGYLFIYLVFSLVDYGFPDGIDYASASYHILMVALGVRPSVEYVRGGWENEENNVLERWLPLVSPYVENTKSLKWQQEQ